MLVDVPLFPLHTVLLPGMDLPLHIFEERYKRLLSDALSSDRRFGIVLIKDGQEVGGPATPHPVGTLAEIRDAQPLPDGGFAVTSIGRQRFRSHHVHTDRPYLHADVELLDEQPGDPLAIHSLRHVINDLLPRYIGLLAGENLSIDERRELQGNLPVEATELSYLVAALLNVHRPEIQALLEAPTAEDRLTQETVLLRREVAILAAMTGDESSGRSPN